MFRKYLKKIQVFKFSSQFRKEQDSFGPIDVPQEKYWGA